MTIYTDGACSGNPGPGGWAAIITDGKEERVVSGGAPHTTNQRMELQAVAEGLAAVPGHADDVMNNRVDALARGAIGS